MMIFQNLKAHEALTAELEKLGADAEAAALSEVERLRAENRDLSTILHVMRLDLRATRAELAELRASRFR